MNLKKIINLTLIAVSSIAMIATCLALWYGYDTEAKWTFGVTAAAILGLFVSNADKVKL